MFADGLRNGFDWTIGGILIAVIIVAAVITIAWIALKQFGVTVPNWAIQMFWVIVVAFVAVLAIKLLLGMW